MKTYLYISRRCTIGVDTCDTVCWEEQPSSLWNAHCILWSFALYSEVFCTVHFGLQHSTLWSLARVCMCENVCFYMLFKRDLVYLVSSAQFNTRNSTFFFPFLFFLFFLSLSLFFLFFWAIWCSSPGAPEASPLPRPRERGAIRAGAERPAPGERATAAWRGGKEGEWSEGRWEKNKR